MLGRTPDAVRNVAFELCPDIPEFKQFVDLPSCGWYFARYDATFWGGTPFHNLQMMRDADDVGQPSGNPSMPLINFNKEGLFDPTQPLFPDMIAGNYEEWTVYSRTFSDHPFHIHQNHMLVTKINGITLPQPEWHDTLIVPAAVCPPDDSTCLGPPANITDATPGSITFQTYFNPITVGCFVAHCHTLNHEDLGMMQRMDILPANGGPSGCKLDGDQAVKPNYGKLLASLGQFPICSSSAPSVSSRKQ